LSPNNIKKRFAATGICPLDRHAVDKHLVPAATYAGNAAGGAGIERGSPIVDFNEDSLGPTSSDHEGEGLAREEVYPSLAPVQEVDLEADLALQPNSGTEHFFVNIDSVDPNVEEEAAGLDRDV
jgi:hypothetical protein